VVTPGVELDDDASVVGDDVRAELGIPTERLVVGLVGRLQPGKGQDRLVAALARLRADGWDVHGLLVGGDAYGLSPEYAALLERLIPELGLEDFVTLTGQVADARRYFSAMDVAVSASSAEGFGIVIVEAMAAGLPVVAVGRGGPLEIVEPGVTGLLADSGKPADLAAAIEPLLANSERRAEMGAAGERRCRQRFAAEVTAERFAGELERIADG
jgi:glycosyltransferase involved in cell wall biosynthesis